jgi:uncharacterized protein
MNPQIMTERFEMRLNQSVIDELDAWRARQGDLPTRSEAVRRLIEMALSLNVGKREIKLGDGEKLIVLMLCDLFRKLKLTSELDLGFLEKVIYGGHNWALEWKYPGIFHGYQDPKTVLEEVVDILAMWSLVEDSYRALSKKDKDRIASEAEPFGEQVQFLGFDGNGESEYLSVACFMIEQLDRFVKFKGRNLNAHMPTLDAHRRMLAVFEPTRRTTVGGNLTASQIVEMLKALIHPSQRKMGAPAHR